MAKVKSTAQKVTQRIDVIDNIGFFVKKYDFDNKYPQRVTDIVNDSGTAKTCLKLYEKRSEESRAMAGSSSARTKGAVPGSNATALTTPTAPGH